MEKINNILIFVSDSLRWDFLPDSLRDRGVAFKTVAQSTYSPPSFATLSTGLYPPQHGVTGFGKTLAKGVKTTYDIDGVDGSYFNEGRLVTDALYRTFKIYEQKTVADLDSPFWYLERDTTTHAAFMQNPHFQNVTVNLYFENRMPDWKAIRADYRKTIENSIQMLDKRLKVLERIAERENTLVVFTSDHGELFGEYGDILHTTPMSPELVYVPTVFIHPSLDEDMFQVDPEIDIIDHVDVIQTCLSTIGKGDALPTEGVDLFSESRPREFGYSHTTTGKFNTAAYRANAIWWRDSGVVHVENNKLTRIAYLLYKLGRGNAGKTRRRLAHKAIPTYLQDEWVFGEPPMSRENAMAELAL